MPTLFMPLLTVLLFWCAACAAMPFLILRDRRLARVKKRSLFDKSASQLAVLCSAGLLLFGIALAADCYFHGRMDSIASVLSRPLWLLFVACESLAALMAVFGRLLGRRAAAGTGWFLAGLFSSAAYLFFLLLVWGILSSHPVAGAAIAADLAPSAALKALYAALSSWIAAFVTTDSWQLPALALAFFVVLAPAAAQLLALLWHIVRRGVDDFGRDYYNFIVGGRARSAAWCAILLLPFTAVLMWVTPPFMAGHLHSLPLASLSVETLALVYNGLLILMPLAVLCCYMTGRDATPLRKRSLVFIAFLLELTALFAVLVRLWN